MEQKSPRYKILTPYLPKEDLTEQSLCRPNSIRPAKSMSKSKGIRPLSTVMSLKVTTSVKKRP